MALNALINPKSVRRAIDTSWGIKDLPDDVISDPVFVSPAISELLSIDPKAAEREGEEQATVGSALNLLLAARVLPSAPLLTKEDFGDGGGYTRQAVDVASRVALLRQQAVDLLLTLPKEGGSTANRLPTFFTLARARRHA